MSDKAQPFTEEERRMLLSNANFMGTHGHVTFGAAFRLEIAKRWDATVAQIEAERDEAKKDRKHAEYGLIGLSDRIGVVMDERDVFANVVYALAAGTNIRAIGAIYASYRERARDAASYGDAGRQLYEYYHGVEEALSRLLAMPGDTVKG